MFDIFFISSNPHHQEYIKLKETFIFAKTAKSFFEARQKSLTNFFWIVWDDLDIDKNFKFNYVPDEWSTSYIHSFLNLEKYDGISLFPRQAEITQHELDSRNFLNCKCVDIVASTPRPYDVFEIDAYDEYLTALENSTTELFWATSRNIIAQIPDVHFTHDNHYDRTTNHAFIHRANDSDHYNGVFLLSKHNKISKKEIEYRHIVNKKEWDIIASTPRPYDVFEIDAYDEYLTALENSTTELFWATSRNIIAQIPDVHFTHDNHYDRTTNHAFIHKADEMENYNGVFLLSKHNKISKKEIEYRHIVDKKEWDIIASTPRPYDVIFISYQEPNADENYQRLLSIIPTAKRVHGITGIHNAHIAAAKLAKTSMIWIVDGDAVIVDDFNFDYRVPSWENDVVHVWRSINPINDLIYGYGGIKLFPRELTINMDTSTHDMTTSISTQFKSMNKTSNITAFNTDPFNTWKSAFRECVKLSSKIIDRQQDTETSQRLDVWCNTGKDRAYGKYAILGANDGVIYGKQYQDNPEALSKINNFAWLKERFNLTYKEEK